MTKRNYGTDPKIYAALKPTMARVEFDAASYYTEFVAQGIDTPTLAKPYVVQYVAETFGYDPHESRKGGALTFVKDSKGHNTTRWYLDRIFGRGLCAHTETPARKEETVKVPAALKASMKSLFDGYTFKQLEQAFKDAKAAKQAAIKIAKAKAAAAK